MREGYQPTPEEMGLAQEQLEAMTIEERPTDHGFEHVDAEGRIVLRTETWGDEQQTVQFTYGEAESSIENAKILEGEKAGHEFRREHPHSMHALSLDGYGSVSAQLETLGQTTVGGPEGSNEPWAHFEVTNSDDLQAFSAIPESDRQTNERGEAYAVLRGDFGGGMEMTIGDRTITIERIGKISVNFDREGKPVKATIHNILWKEQASQS